MFFNHIILILHWAGFSLVSHHKDIFDRSGLTAAMNEGMFTFFFWKNWNASLSCFLNEVLTVRSSSVAAMVSLGG